MSYPWEGLKQARIDQIKPGDVLVCGLDFNSNVVFVKEVKPYNSMLEGNTEYQIWGNWYNHPDEIKTSTAEFYSFMSSEYKFYYYHREKTSGFAKWIKHHG